MSISAQKIEFMRRVVNKYDQMQAARQPSPAIDPLDAESIALILLSLDDSAWRSIASFRDGYLQAQAEGNSDEMAKMAGYAAEVIAHAGGGAPIAEADLQEVDLDSNETNAAEAGPREGFHEVYTRLKHAAGLSTQAQVAVKAGISPATVQAIEAGRVRPQFRTIQRLAEAFGCTPQELLASL